MSLAETQQIMVMLQEIMQILNNVQAKTRNVVEDTPKVKEHEISLRKQVHTLNMMIALLGTFSGDKTISGASRKIQQLMMSAFRLYMLFMALDAMAGPWGLAYALGNAAATGMTLGNMMAIGE